VRIAYATIYDPNDRVQFGYRPPWAKVLLAVRI
jgi:hypothetical protein